MKKKKVKQKNYNVSKNKETEKMAGASKEEDKSAMIPQGGGDSSVTGLIVSFLKKFATVGLVWGVGYMNWSVAWFIGPIILTVLRKEWKKDSEQRRMAAQACALAGEQKTIMGKMSELPSWVYFPDYDRAEWLNRVRIYVDTTIAGV